MTSLRIALALFALAILSVSSALAQGQNQNQSVVLALPLASQRASVSQRVGLTDVTIVYHRPLVSGRKIWGDVVPLGEVWRAGANENTTIAFTDDVTVEGRPLPKGTYGLHMIPGAEGWTVVFSKNATSWGSFSYDEKEDALRVSAKPVPAEQQEALLYSIDQPAQDSAVVTLRWEKLAVPFRVGVDTPAVTLAAIRRQLRDVPGFTWMGGNDAAIWALENKTAYDDAMKWIESSIQGEERFENLQTKSRLLAATGKTAEAETVMKAALAKAGAPQLHNYGRQLLGEKKTKEAVEIFQMNARKNPDIWFVHAGLARGLSATGDYKGAAKAMKVALAQAPEPQKKYIQGLVQKLEAGQNIN